MTLMTLFEQKWQSLEPDEVRRFLKDIELAFTFYEFNLDLRHHVRTTNHLERFLVQDKKVESLWERDS